MSLAGQVEARCRAGQLAGRDQATFRNRMVACMAAPNADRSRQPESTMPTAKRPAGAPLDTSIPSPQPPGAWVAHWRGLPVRCVERFGDDQDTGTPVAAIRRRGHGCRDRADGCATAGSSPSATTVRSACTTLSQRALRFLSPASVVAPTLMIATAAGCRLCREWRPEGGPRLRRGPPSGERVQLAGAGAGIRSSCSSSRSRSYIRLKDTCLQSRKRSTWM